MSTKPSSPFANKVVLITGGTAGIGRATAIAFAEQGANVVVSGRREVEGAESVALVEEAGGKGLFVRTDVSREEDIAALVGRTVDHFGRLDIAFNNAGVDLSPTVITEITEETYRGIFDINVAGVAFGMKHQVPALLKNGGGVIINNASVLGLRPVAGRSLYNASKFAVIGLTKSVALEYASQGIRVNAVCPAITETDMTAAGRENPQIREYLLKAHPAGRFATPEEIAAAVLYLASPGAAFTTGVALSVDGGFTV